MTPTQVAELIGLRQFRLVEREITDPAPGEVQVRVHSVGVCGSDLHSYAEGGIGGKLSLYPMVLGHEPAGVVARLGSGVSGWRSGDRAALEPAIYCYHCRFCMAGCHNVCENLRFLSSPGDPGFFRRYVNLPAGNLLPLPPQIGMNEAILIEPLAVALHSMKFGQPKPGETAAVFGAGPIGLLTLAVLKLSGAARVWVIDPVPARRAIARQMGADSTLDPSEVDTVPKVDVVFDCAAKGQSIHQSIEVARSAGRVVFTGIPSETESPIDFHAWRRKELALFQVRRSNRESGQARDLLVAHLSRFAPLITHTRPLDQIGPAFAQLEQYADGVGKVVIQCS